jgi:hypothetical protein
MPDENEKNEDKPKTEEGRVMHTENFTGGEMVVHAQSTEWLKEKPELEVKEEPVLGKDIVVVASNPQQMQSAQANLVKHFGDKLKCLNDELVEAQDNVKIAKARKWKTGPFQTQADKIQKNIDFYTKIKAALDAGYVIIPNFDDLDIFAIRTTRKKPKANIAKGGPNWVQPPESQKSNRPVLGEGRYVNADTINHVWTADITKVGATQKEYRRMATAMAFDSIDFPFHLAKPQILNSTAEAMKVLAFDDIGVSPSRRIRRGDPMIIGRIVNGTGFKAKVVSFLITWFVDTKDL